MPRNLQIDPIEKTQINLSGDENGPLNGWEFSTRITNNGDKDIEALRMRISFLDADGLIVDRQDYTVIGCGDYCQRMFVSKILPMLNLNQRSRASSLR